MGTDMMGQFGATGAFEPVPADIDPSAYLRERLEYERRRWRRLGRAVVRRDARSSTTGPTWPRRPGSPSAPATWDDLKAMAKAMKEKGGAKWGISLGTKNWQEYFPFLWSNGGDVVDASGNSDAQLARRPSRR